MLIRVLPNKIPAIWETIKYAAVHVDAVDEAYRSVYLNNLLHDLLCGKAQCIAHISEAEGKIINILITREIIDDTCGQKHLVVGLAYAFERSQPEDWDRIIDVLKEIAAADNCSKVSFVTNNPKVLEIGSRNGFVELHRKYVYSLGRT